MMAATGDHQRRKAAAADPQACKELFLRACREVFRDGVVEARENVLLQVLMAVLGVGAEDAREHGHQARREARENRLPDNPITGAEIYQRAVVLP